MKRWLSGILLVVAALGGAQGPGVQSLFDSVRPQISVVVREHPTTADLVEITAVDANYPPELLRAQAEAIGAGTGSPVRGLHMVRQEMGTGTGGGFLKATFATDHLIDRAAGVLRLQPIVRAFVGGRSTGIVTGLSIMFDGEVPNVDTLRIFPGKGVTLEGRTTGSPAGLEYRVHITATDPSEVVIPERLQHTADKKEERTKGPSNTVLIALGALAAVAAGALVYLALLRSPSSRGSR